MRGRKKPIVVNDIGSICSKRTKTYIFKLKKKTTTMTMGWMLA
jgi:hypothetical protein